MRRPPARPGGCAPSSTPRPPTISDHRPPGNLNPHDHQEVTMNRTRPFRPVRRLAGALAALAAALLAAAAAAPLAFAPSPSPPGQAGGPCSPPPVARRRRRHAPGWQIALIAIAAAALTSLWRCSWTGPGAEAEATLHPAPNRCWRPPVPPHPATPAGHSHSNPTSQNHHHAPDRSPPRSAARAPRPAHQGQLPLPHQRRTSGQETPNSQARPRYAGRSRARNSLSTHDPTMPPVEL